MSDSKAVLAHRRGGQGLAELMSVNGAGRTAPHASSVLAMPVMRVEPLVIGSRSERDERQVI
jgi:hypothetical protein